MAYYLNDITIGALSKQVRDNTLFSRDLMIDDVKVGAIYEDEYGNSKYLSIDLPNGNTMNVTVTPRLEEEIEIGQG